MACSNVVAKILQNMRKGPYWEGVWPCVPEKDGPHGELFFFIKEEPVAVSNEVPFRPLCFFGIAQGVGADWSTPFGSSRITW